MKKHSTAVLALSSEGVARRENIFNDLSESAYVLKEKSVVIPKTKARIEEVDFRAFNIKRTDWAIASLGLLAQKELAINKEMLKFSLESKFKGKIFDKAMETVNKVSSKILS